MKELPSKRNPAVGLLTSPWAILVAIGVAVFIGLMFRDVAAILRPFGQIYLYMIEMTVIPIIISAVISSVAGLAKSSGIRSFLLRMVIVFVLMLVSIALIGTVTGIIGRPGAGLDEQTRNTLGSIVKTQQSQYAPDQEISLNSPVEPTKQTGLVDFLVQIVPRNIFAALTSGRALELIFFSIIFGVAIGVLSAKQGSSLIDVFDGLFKAFQKIISWLMVVLPFGLVCLLSSQIASTGFAILLAMMKFIAVFFAAGIAVILVDLLIIWRRSRLPLGKVLKSVLDPIVISLVTRSSFATLPSAIKSLSQDLGFFERSTNLFFSLGTTLGRFGNILYFSIAAIFVAQLYGADLGVTQYGILLVGSLLAGVATAGASGIATLNLMAIVLTPLSLPFEAVLIIFIAIDTIADPMRTLLIVLNNMAANTLIVPRVEAMNRRTEERHRPAREFAAPADLLARVVSRRELVVALEGRNALPFYAVDADGAASGLALERARALADGLGVSLKLNRGAAAAADLVRMVREQEADIALGPCNFHKVFENELLYSAPYLATREAMLADRGRIARLKQGSNLMASLKTYEGKVGVVRGSMHERMAARVLPRADRQSYASSEDMADAVASGEILAGFGSELEFRYILERRPSHDSRLSILVFANLPAEFRFAVAPGQERALAEIDRIIASRRGSPASLPPA